MKKIIAASLVFAATPVLADSPIRSADARVSELRGQLVKAERTNDSVTIATARAKLKAAQAAAWAARNPAPQPMNVAAGR